MPVDLALLPTGQRMLAQLKNTDTTGLTLVDPDWLYRRSGRLLLCA